MVGINLLKRRSYGLQRPASNTSRDNQLIKCLTIPHLMQYLAAHGAPVKVGLSGLCRFTIWNNAGDDKNFRCLIIGGNGNDLNPTKYYWAPGPGDPPADGFGTPWCGFNSEAELVANKQTYICQ